MELVDSEPTVDVVGSVPVVHAAAKTAIATNATVLLPTSRECFMWEEHIRRAGETWLSKQLGAGKLGHRCGVHSSRRQRRQRIWSRLRVLHFATPYLLSRPQVDLTVEKRDHEGQLSPWN